MGSLAKGEVNNTPSLTVPNQAMTVKEIISRTQNGLSASGIRVPSYDGGEDPTGLDGRDFRTLDLSEKHELLRLNTEKIKDLQAKARQNAIEMDEARRPKPIEPTKPVESDPGLQSTP